MAIHPKDAHGSESAFAEIDLKPHLRGQESTEGLGLAASEGVLWVMTPHRLLRVRMSGAVECALEAPRAEVFETHSAAEHHVAVATTTQLFVSRESGPFVSVSLPKRRKGARVSTLLACPNGGIWLELEVGQPVQAQWWYRDPTGLWEERPDAVAEQLRKEYGIVGPPRRLRSPCLGPLGTVVGLDDQRESNPEADDHPDAPLYVRRQTLIEVGADGWSEPLDLQAAGVPAILSGCGEALWLGSVALAVCREEDEPVYLIGRADAVYRVWHGRAERIDLGVSGLVSDGDRIVLAMGVDEDDALFLSRDGGRVFEPFPTLAPRRLARESTRAAAAFNRGEAFLGVIASDHAHTAPTRAWVVRADHH